MNSFEQGWEEIRMSCKSFQNLDENSLLSMKAAFYGGMSHAIHVLIDRESGDLVGLLTDLERLARDRWAAADDLNASLSR